MQIDMLILSSLLLCSKFPYSVRYITKFRYKNSNFDIQFQTLNSPSNNLKQYSLHRINILTALKMNYKVSLIICSEE